jgi:hypothetical protein
MSDWQFLLSGEVFRVQGLAAVKPATVWLKAPRAERLEVHSAVSAEVFGCSGRQSKGK